MRTGVRPAILRFGHPLASDRPKANIDSTLVKVIVFKTQMLMENPFIDMR